MHDQMGDMMLYVTEAGDGQAFMVASALKENNASQAANASYAKIAEVLLDNGMAIVHERIFGSQSVEAEVMAARSSTPAGAAPSQPRTRHLYPRRSSLGKRGFAGFIIQAAVAAEERWTIRDGALPAAADGEEMAAHIWCCRTSTEISAMQGTMRAGPNRFAGCLIAPSGYCVKTTHHIIT